MASLKIQQLDPIDHIIKRPDMYVGSTRVKQSEEYVAVDGFSIKRQMVSISPALLRIFIEALSNAIDNVQRSKEAGVTCSKIKVTINKTTGETSVWNDGFVIPIEKHDDTNYKHTLIFGVLRTSTNFDDNEERTVSGRNGLGIKLLNVFSKTFSVTGVDPANKKMFYQEWSNNMRSVTPPKITTSSLKTGFTKVSWVPDFSVLGMDCYTDDVIQLYTKYVIDAAMLTKLNVYLNDEKIPVKSLVEYSRMFTAATSETISIKGVDSDVLISASNGDFEAISFVNGVFTMNGGKHVDSWSEAIFRPIVDHFNKPKRPQVTIKDVKQFYRIFVVSTLVNPEFTSQSKTELASPDVKAVVDPKTITSILRWSQTKKINEIIEGKEMLVLKKSDAKRKTFKAICGYEPANEAGGKKSAECTLALCEGLSAKTFAIKGMKSELFGRQGRDWLGVYALRGKILNVIKSNRAAIAENKVITDIIQAIGLKHGVDYTNDAAFSTLNYGRLMILTDADTDGKHIAGLIITFVAHLFPSLLARQTPFLYNAQTPIAKFTLSNKSVVSFFNLRTADTFLVQHKGEKMDIKYYKGLGSHSDSEIRKCFGQRVVCYVNDTDASGSIQKAFGKDTTERKEWMELYDPHKVQTCLDETTRYPPQNITTFIDEDFIEFPVDDCKRSIPSIMDGLKQSQRKILYSCFKRKLASPLKVAQLAGYVAEVTNYHHGEQNLYETITKMANEFVNSNNIPLLFRDGQFGSRSEGGKDAAHARYIFTCLEEITRYIFKPEDDDLLEHVIDDGDEVEPVYYIPIIPMILVNGSDGIGSGWSSFIPNYNPMDLVKMVRDWLANPDYEPTPARDNIHITIFDPILPWYRGFTGTITGLSSDKFQTDGVHEINENGLIVVKEIPIGMTIQSFQQILDKLREEKKIKNYKNYSTANIPHYVIDMPLDMIPSLKLNTTLSTTNMVLFDPDGRIKKYNTIEEIVVDFCKSRINFYVKRKQQNLEKLSKQLLISKNKQRFITSILNDTFTLKGKKESQIIQELCQGGYDKVDNGFKYLLSIPIGSFSTDQIEDLTTTIDKTTTAIQTVEGITERDMWELDLQKFEEKYAQWVTIFDTVPEELSTDSTKVTKRRKKKE